MILSNPVTDAMAVFIHAGTVAQAAVPVGAAVVGVDGSKQAQTEQYVLSTLDPQQSPPS